MKKYSILPTLMCALLSILGALSISGCEGSMVQRRMYEPPPIVNSIQQTQQELSEAMRDPFPQLRGYCRREAGYAARIDQSTSLYGGDIWVGCDASDQQLGIRPNNWVPIKNQGSGK